MGRKADDISPLASALTSALTSALASALPGALTSALTSALASALAGALVVSRRPVMSQFGTAGLAVAATVALTVLTDELGRRRRQPQVIHPGGTAVAVKVAEDLLIASPRRFEELFRMTRQEFDALVDWLSNSGLEGSKYLSLAHKVMVFLWILGHNESQRNAAHRFHIGQGTVSKLVHEVLPGFVALHQAFVRPQEEDWLDPIIELDPKFNAFNGCIGAIDGTHIPAFVPVREQGRYRDRKGALSQNVFAAVRFDGSFAYVLAGAEGSMNDASLLAQALGRSFAIPPHRYYLADAGFGTRRGVIVPFANVRYHLQDWRNADNPPTTAKELYNLRHARLRVVVERAFGHLKRRFKIIRSSAPEYALKDQRDILFAVTGLHNFILRQRQPLVGITVLEQDALARAKARIESIYREFEQGGQ